MTAMAIELTGRDLTLDEIERVAADGESVTLAEESLERVGASRQVVEDILRRDEVVYGINTGFGNFRNVVIPHADLERLQLNLIRSHSAGVGDPFSEEDVRAILVLRINALASGYSGIDPETLDAAVAMLNAGVHPVVPQKGSVGASGDLAPLAHVALVLIGEGEAFYRGERLSGGAALERAGLSPCRLHPKDGLALINGTQVISALLAGAVSLASRLVRSADVIGALTLDTLLGTDVAFDPRIHEARPHHGQIVSARNLRRLLQGSELRKSHEACDRVQDSYSLRCMPQVHGAVRDALGYVRGVLETEINSATDNPMIFVDGRDVVSGGNFHGQPVALAADFLTIALAGLGAISERRVERLVNPDLSDLPGFLVEEGGLNSGFMIVHVTAAALASENKTYSHPASVDSIPTSANQEDHVSMGVTAARKTKEVAKNLAHILAIELLCAGQALEFRRPLKTSAALEAVHARLRQDVPSYEHDRAHYLDIEAANKIVGSGGLLHVVEQTLGTEGAL
ncbi:MAG: histidine ammonia-lyase [Acidobacteriota bacterium]|nr:MAG: histidine ammonia-lyase [Acidobacteriota bacterium]